MLSPKELAFRGVGDSCSRSRSAMQAELVEFEAELLEAMAKMETGELEAVVVNGDENNEAK